MSKNSLQVASKDILVNTTVKQSVATETEKPKHLCQTKWNDKSPTKWKEIVPINKTLLYHKQNTILRHSAVTKTGTEPHPQTQYSDRDWDGTPPSDTV